MFGVIRVSLARILSSKFCLAKLILYPGSHWVIEYDDWLSGFLLKPLFFFSKQCGYAAQHRFLQRVDQKDLKRIRIT